MERKFDRRVFGRVALGAAAALIGVDTHTRDFPTPSERLFNPATDPEKRLFLIKSGLLEKPSVKPQIYTVEPPKNRLILPQLAKGEMVPPKKEPVKETKYIARKPEFTYKEMEKLTKVTKDSTPSPLTYIPTDAPLVALTVDDGFDESAIDIIFSVAKKRGITYTDFMKGEKRRDFSKKVKMLADSEIVEFGNHTETHRDQRNAPVPVGFPNRRPTWEEFKEDLYIAENFLVENFNQTTLPYVRPPGGAADIYTTDWNEQMGFLPLNWYAIIEDMPLNIPRGAIILAHYRQSTVDVFERWVDGIMSQGLFPTAVSNLIAHANNDFWGRLDQ